MVSVYLVIPIPIQSSISIDTDTGIGPPLIVAFPNDLKNDTKSHPVQINKTCKISEIL